MATGQWIQTSELRPKSPNLLVATKKLRPQNCAGKRTSCHQFATKKTMITASCHVGLKNATHLSFKCRLWLLLHPFSPNNMCHPLCPHPTHTHKTKKKKTHPLCHPHPPPKKKKKTYKKITHTHTHQTKKRNEKSKKKTKRHCVHFAFRRPSAPSGAKLDASSRVCASGGSSS